MKNYVNNPSISATITDKKPPSCHFSLLISHSSLGFPRPPENFPNQQESLPYLVKAFSTIGKAL